MRFTPLQTYKVLKHTLYSVKRQVCFTPLQTYKVLKRYSLLKSTPGGFTPLQTYMVLKLFAVIKSLHPLFYTITNLQGSQTSNEIITEPNILVNMCKLPSNV